METFTPKISDSLRTFVTARGTSQRQIALAAGIDPTQLCRFLQGKRGLSLEDVDALGAFLRLRLVGGKVRRTKAADGDAAER